MTKKQQAMYQNFYYSNDRYLSDVYTTYSAQKSAAYNRCLRIADSLNADRIRICSANTFGFTFGFTYQHEDGTTHLQYHTPQNVYDFSIE